MNKMQEIDIIKYLVLDEEQLDIMNFISKPSVSMTNDNDKPLSAGDEEYRKFFCPREKVNSIDVENIDKLKKSFLHLVSKQPLMNTEKRMLYLFDKQLRELTGDKSE